MGGHHPAELQSHVDTESEREARSRPLWRLRGEGMCLPYRTGSSLELGLCLPYQTGSSLGLGLCLPHQTGSSLGAGAVSSSSEQGFSEHRVVGSVALSVPALHCLDLDMV